MKDDLASLQSRFTMSIELPRE